MPARWGFVARTIVEELEASNSLDALTKKFRRFDEAYEALKWLLAHKCNTVKCKTASVGGVSYYLHRRAGDFLAKTPDITILFTFDDNEVVVIDVTAEIVEGDQEA